MQWQMDELNSVGQINYKLSPSSLSKKVPNYSVGYNLVTNNTEGHATHDDSHVFRDMTVNEDILAPENRSSYLKERKSFDQPLAKNDTALNTPTRQKRSIASKAGEM
jgi:hypothetical protein